MSARGSHNPSPHSSSNEHLLRERTAREAYAIYERRGRADGHALEDWLEAERQVRRLSGSTASRAGTKPPAKPRGKTSSNGSRARRG